MDSINKPLSTLSDFSLAEAALAVDKAGAPKERVMSLDMLPVTKREVLEKKRARDIDVGKKIAFTLDSIAATASVRTTLEPPKVRRKAAVFDEVGDLAAMLAGSAEVAGYYERGHDVPPAPRRGYKSVCKKDGLWYLEKVADDLSARAEAVAFGSLKNK